MGAIEVSDRTQRRILPSSPADASISPVSREFELFLTKARGFNLMGLTLWAKADDIDGLGVPGQGCQVCNLPLFALSFDAP